MNRTVLILFFLILLISTTATITTLSELENPVQTQTNTSFNTSNTLTNPINITNNSQLANQAFSGNGSRTNPYIIENMIINCNNSIINGINIQNTNKYFVLKNITVSHCSGGFYLNNVIFGSISNSIAITNTGNGFAIFSSTNIILIDNKAIYDNTGFSLSNSNNLTLNNNTVTNNVHDGFYLYLGSFNNILMNNIATTNGQDGFDLDLESSNNILINNTANTNNDDGFGFGSFSYTHLVNSSGMLPGYIIISDFNILISNIANKNKGNGFVLSSSYRNTLVNNTASDNTLCGFVISSDYNTLVNNTATENQGSGFLLSSSSYDPTHTTTYYDSVFTSNTNILTNNTATYNNYGFCVNFSFNNILKNNIGAYNQIDDYYAVNSNNITLINNRFTTAFSSATPINVIEILGVLGFLLLSIIILTGVFLYIYPRKKRVINSHSSNKTIKLDTNLKLAADATMAISLVEDILKEEYQAPDYATALKIEQGGFPDYATFKQALDKGITIYTEWIKNQKQ